MLTDKYLIEYLIENGYTREEIEASSFNMDSLRDDFSKPIELSKVTNLDELKLFFTVTSSFIISKEDVESGKAYKVSQMLINYKFIGNEADFKIDKLFINRNMCGTIKDGSLRWVKKHISFENIDFSDVELVIDDMTAQRDIKSELDKDNKSKVYVIRLGEGLASNVDFTLEQPVEQELPDSSFDKCSNINLAKFNGFRCVINDSININCNEKSDLVGLTIDNCKNIDLSNVNNVISIINLANLEELDLGEIPAGCDYEIKNIKKCFASRDAEFSKLVEFNNVEFYGTNGRIAFERLNLNQASFHDESVKFSVQNVTVKNSDFKVVKGLDIEERLKIDNCFNADSTMEELIERSYENEEFKLEVNDISGYDIRRALRILDLKKEDNKDLLDNPHKLREVLKDNKYLISILVPENLTDQQKNILREFAPNVNYTYNFKGISDLDNNYKYNPDSMYGFYENAPEHVNFDEFMEAERIFNKIVSGINPSWSEIEKFKYLYNSLGKRVSYDINVLEDKNEDNDSYNRANLVARNPFSSIISGNGVCAGYSEMYQYVCRKAGLTCDMESNGEHRYNLIEYTNDNGERVKSYCDLTWDAIGSKYNTRSNYFGFGCEDTEHKKLKCENAVKIPEDKVKEIDKNIGYEYMDDKYMSLVKEAKEIEGLKDRVNFLLENIMKVQDISSMSNHEVVKVAWIFLSNSGIGMTDMNIINGFIRKNERADKSVRDILWIKDETEKGKEAKYLYYTFNSEQQVFKTLESEVVEELLASGMLEFYKDQKLPGFEDWMSEKEYKEMRNSGQDR